jgi:DNA-binding beta-propeller fold protein YncE
MKQQSLILTCALLSATFSAPAAQDRQSGVPVVEVDPFWPKPLPDNWIVGDVSGVAVDSRDHVWIVHRPGTLTDRDGRPPTSVCCVPAPPIIEFDSDGNVVQAWGGESGEGYQWPAREHGITVDHLDNVWVSGAGRDDHVVLKFTRAGEFLLQIGHRGERGGSNDTETLGGPCQIRVEPQANEVYTADGEGGHRRVVVFDAATGAYKRHWGAHGNRPDDDAVRQYDPDRPSSPQFGNSVHCVRLSRDRLVYVCDREHNRIQVFRNDGTFVREVVVARETRFGSIWDLDFSSDPEQAFLYVADGSNQKVWILRRDRLQIVGSFGGPGRNAGQFLWINAIAVDSDGNVYTGEVTTGNRIQKFLVK